MAAVVATKIKPVSGRHKPERIAAGVARPDLQPPEARWIDEGVVVEDRAYNRCRCADAVATACGEAEGNCFIRFVPNIRRGIHRDNCGVRTCGKAHRLGFWCGGNAGVVDAESGGTAHGVVHR